MSTWNKISYIRYPVTRMFQHHKNNGTRELLAVSNNTLYKDVDGVLTSIPFNTIPSLTSSEVKMMSYKDRNINDVVLIADRGKLKVYNGTDVSEVTPHNPTTEEQTDPGLNDLSNLTNFRAIAIKKDRIFAAAHPTVKNRVSFCHHDPTIGYAVYDYWPAAFFIDVATEENDEIVELKVFRDALIIFCKRSVWALYGDGRTIDDYELKKINVPTGCISPKSVQIVGNHIFYLSDDHVYALYSTDENYVSANIVSQNIENTLKSIGRADKEKAVGAFFDNKYFLSFPNGTCLMYDTLLGAWVKWTNVQANSFLNRDGVLYFSSNTGFIYKFNENLYNDDGAAISFSMKTKILDFNMEVQQKKIRRLWVVAKQYDGYKSTFDSKGFIDRTIIVDLAGNGEDVDTGIGAIWDQSLWDDSLWDFAEVIQQELRIRQKGKNIQIIISNEKVNEPVTIYGIVFEYKVKKP
jgi:hypothetical protein